jgi:hypothetical protein
MVSDTHTHTQEELEKAKAESEALAAEQEEVRRKRLLLQCHFMLKMTLLPRQAWDKHGESTQKRDAISYRRLSSMLIATWCGSLS